MTEPKKELTGRVLEIQRMSTEDGPGIRTTFFFKGCPLHCAWCHNPESISARPQVQWVESRCIGCLTCVKVCPEKALTATDHGIAIDRDLCTGCGTCAEECPSTAMELLGREWTVPDLVAEAVKDSAYFRQSEGGITVSGGEALLQAEFVAAFLAECLGQGLSTAVDTCGHVSRRALDLALPQADLVLFDLKVMDQESHKKFTGQDNKLILENLEYVRERIKGPGRPHRLWIRTPIIPGATDTEENIRAVGRYIGRNLAGVVERWELCAFNNLCRDKYKRLGLDWAYKDSPLMTADRMEELTAAARTSGVDPDLPVWTGATRLEKIEADNDADTRSAGAPACC